MDVEIVAFVDNRNRGCGRDISNTVQAAAGDFALADAGHVLSKRRIRRGDVSERSGDSGRFQRIATG